MKELVHDISDARRLNSMSRAQIHTVRDIYALHDLIRFRPHHALYSSTPLALAVHAAVTANTFAVYGAGQVKELTELVPGILNQLGPDSLASLRKLAESYQAIQQSQQRPSGAGDDDDDDVPDLVENFENVEDNKGGDDDEPPALEELN